MKRPNDTTDITWLGEAEAAEKLRMKPRTLRLQATARGRYAGREPLRVVFCQVGRRFQYSKQSIEALLLANSNAS